MLRISLTWGSLASLLLVGCCRIAAAEEPVVLWPDGAPGAVGDEPQDVPLLRIYKPPAGQATGAGIIVCPGGGYGVLATDHEGQQVARFLNRIGVTGFVLRYRLGPRYGHPAPLQDAQRAIRYVRANAKSLGVATDRIGIMGFSAGGHLASTAATHFDSGQANSGSEIERTSCRPDFVILGYPVVSFADETTHRGSRRNLLGEDPDSELVKLLSNELQVSETTPPAFLFHTSEDKAVAVENSLKFYAACVAAGVPAELHVYQFGPHGVGLAEGDPVTSSWRDRLADWLRGSGLLADIKRAAVSGTVRVNGEPLRWGTVSFVSAIDNAPVAFTLVSRGKFEIPAYRGAVVGMCRIEVRDLGAVEADPTIDDATRLDRGELSCEILADDNSIVVEVKPE